MRAFGATVYRIECHTQLSAAFIGVSSFNFSYAASLVALNTFGWDVLAILLLLVIVDHLWPSGPAAGKRPSAPSPCSQKSNLPSPTNTCLDLPGHCRSSSSSDSESSSSRSDATYSFVTNSNSAQKTVVLVALVYRSLCLLFATVACFVLRRHLMVWAVFAPKVTERERGERRGFEKRRGGDF